MSPESSCAGRSETLRFTANLPIYLQEGAQVKASLGIDIAEFGSHRAGMTRQATASMALGARRIAQVVSTGVDGIASEVEGFDRTGMQAGFQFAGDAG